MDQSILYAVITLLGSGLTGIGLFTRHMFYRLDKQVSENNHRLVTRVEKLELDVEKCHSERLLEAEARGELKAQVALFNATNTPRRKRALPAKAPEQTVNLSITTAPASGHSIPTVVEHSSHSIETSALGGVSTLPPFGEKNVTI